MEDHGLAARARRPEPSWPTVIATTVRLWLERHGDIGARFARVRFARVRRLLVLAVVVVAGLVAVVVTDAIVQRGPTSAAALPRKPAAAPLTPAEMAALRAASVTRGQAAAWVARQVSTDAVVACDPAMCAELHASGLAAGRLLMLGPAAADPLGSDVIVATPAVRSQFGSRLGSVYAPLVIASFGAGAERIDVRAIAPEGAVAYESGLAADRRARIAAGRQLLRNRHIKVSAGARAALAAGRVDTRLLATLAALAAQQPVRVVAFGDPSPGASTAVPLRSAELGPAGAGAPAKHGASRHGTARQGVTRHGTGLRQMLSLLQEQLPPYLPAQIRVTGGSLLSIEFPAPGPLGLLGGM